MKQSRLRRTSKSHFVCLIFIGATLTLALVGYALALKYRPAYDESSPYFTCLFKKLCGLDCFGCGGQRAISHLLNGDVDSALQSNAYAVLVLVPYLSLQVLLFWLAIFKHPMRRDHFTASSCSRRELVSFILVMTGGLIFAIFRNVPSL
jgi:hypothetical protein